jgi:hypothetical protein
VIEIDSAGIIVWENTIGGAETDRLRTAVEAPDGGYLLAGHSNSDQGTDKGEDSRGSYDYWVIKLDSAGLLSWQKTVGGADWDEMYAMDYGDNGPVLGGFSRSGVTGEKTDTTRGFFDFWIIRLFQTPVVGMAEGPVAVAGNHLTLFPNPAQAMLYLEFDKPPGPGAAVHIRDLAGRQVFERPAAAAAPRIDVAAWPRGMYLLQFIEPGAAPVTARFVLY